MLIRNFSSNKEEEALMKEGWCFVRNTEDCFKKYWCFVRGKELFLQKVRQGPQCEIMHCLANTFINAAKEFMTSDGSRLLYPLKI